MERPMPREPPVMSACLSDRSGRTAVEIRRVWILRRLRHWYGNVGRTGAFRKCMMAEKYSRAT